MPIGVRNAASFGLAYNWAARSDGDCSPPEPVEAADGGAFVVALSFSMAALFSATVLTVDVDVGVLPGKLIDLGGALAGAVSSSSLSKADIDIDKDESAVKPEIAGRCGRESERRGGLVDPRGERVPAPKDWRLEGGLEPGLDDDFCFAGPSSSSVSSEDIVREAARPAKTPPSIDGRRPEEFCRERGCEARRSLALVDGRRETAGDMAYAGVGGLS